MRGALGFGDLVLCGGTAAAAGLFERIAAAAGFAGLSPFPADDRRVRAAGRSNTDLRARLADAGLAVAEIDPLLTWPAQARVKVCFGHHPAGNPFELLACCGAPPA